jgi:hypothetical protein
LAFFLRPFSYVSREYWWNCGKKESGNAFTLAIFSEMVALDDKRGGVDAGGESGRSKIVGRKSKGAGSRG